MSPKKTKTARILEYKRANPTHTPMQTAEALKAYGITPSFVSNVICMAKKQAEPTPLAHAAAIAKTAVSFSREELTAAKLLLKACGDRATAQAAVATVHELTAE